MTYDLLARVYNQASIAHNIAVDNMQALLSRKGGCGLTPEYMAAAAAQDAAWKTLKAAFDAIRAYENGFDVSRFSA